jgi:hypothetical protein
MCIYIDIYVYTNVCLYVKLFLSFAFLVCFDAITLLLKIVLGLAQVVEHLPSKHETLS